MKETISEKIDRFIYHNEKIINKIMSIYTHENNGIDAKILFCSLLDSLSKCAYPDIKNNKKRFTETITRHSKWKESDNVSLLHFVRAFEIVENISNEFSALQDEVNILFYKNFKPSTNGISDHILTDIDPIYSDIEDKWPKNVNGNKIDLGIVTLEKLQHKSLLWLYRNSLVHEYRIPGGGMEPISHLRDKPYYQEIFTFVGCEIKNLQIEHKNFELHYPISFFKQICEDCLHSIAGEYREKNTSPFEIYSEGEYWIPEFND